MSDLIDPNEDREVYNRAPRSPRVASVERVFVIIVYVVLALLALFAILRFAGVPIGAHEPKNEPPTGCDYNPNGCNQEG